MAVREASELDIICKCRASGMTAGEAIFAQQGGSLALPPQLRHALMVYKCYVQPWVFRLLALALGAFSCILVWSEATIKFKVDLSPFSHVRHAALPVELDC